MKIYDLKSDYRKNPIGIDSKQPVFSWKMESKKQNVMQTAYAVVVKCGGKTVWETGKIISEQSNNIIYEGKELASKAACEVTVTVWDNQNQTAEAKGFFETAFMKKSDWQAKWVEPKQNPAFEEKARKIVAVPTEIIPVEDISMEPSQMIRKEFKLGRQIKKARMYATAHGIYYCEINGKRVGDIQYAPGNSSYDKYLEYQTYDITNDITEEWNAVAMILGDGWYTGKVGITGESCQFGNKLAGLFQIEVEYEDGSSQTILSDEECMSAVGAIDYADIFVGEQYDARKEKTGFSQVGYLPDDLQYVDIVSYGYENLHAQYGEPVRICEILKPVKIFRSPKDEIILDAGQVLCGRLRMRVRGPKGTKVVLEHTETLDREGNYLCNIIGRYIRQTDTYLLKGEGTEVFEPELTFHGFRYVRITGYPGMPSADDFEICVIHTDMERTGTFECSDQRLNQLQHNIFWSQRSNMLSIPTDCPQRERAGWTGDVQIFAATACYNMDVNAFFRRWLRIVEKDQTKDGQIPIVVPYIKAYHPKEFLPGNTNCSAGWGDVAVILPWKMYLAYGDKKVLEDHYEMMQKWVEYIRFTAEQERPEQLEGELTQERKEWQKYLWNTNFHFGDWLTPSVSFDFETGDVDMMQSAFRTMDIVPTCFYAYSTYLMEKISEVLGKKEEKVYYHELNEKVRQAFWQEYVNGNGTIATQLQGVYVLALWMRLIPEPVREHALNRLLEMIHENGDKIDTGFLSVPFLLDLLTEEGKTKVAYDLLFQEECPSWLYEVKMGATTMWEAWQAILPDGTPTSVSYNHYAFGCVGDWMYRNIGGLHAGLPGYKKAIIKPVLDTRITSAKAELETAYGLLGISWRLEGKHMLLDASIPCNTTAEIYLPLENGAYKIETVGSGKYSYSYTYGKIG